MFKVLEYNGPLTQKGIVQESMLSARTVRYALERLENIGIVDEDVYFADARQNLYQLDGPKQAEADGGQTQERESPARQSQSQGSNGSGCDDGHEACCAE
ncbi:ArsR family transcriptional regulator [Candidatus Halobonum tyrrellensis G22]|uniref:ArsR family transcriptional regulator n=1 Tax=Candidatus Halobonum tyrrellensis G22 TaxID=1324957 RepID=V4IWL0_9EURY|nr:ArsR family transcriptional regulator [Candidatus Halobonum tyrrellensis G22]